MSAETFVNLFILLVFSMLFVFFFTGIFRKKFFLSFGKIGLSANYYKHKRAGKKAVFMNILLVIGVVFAFIGFSSSMGVIYTTGQIIVSLIISFFIYFFLERLGLKR
jgi:uncharacterized membrane protein